LQFCHKRIIQFISLLDSSYLELLHVVQSAQCAWSLTSSRRVGLCGTCEGTEESTGSPARGRTCDPSCPRTSRRRTQCAGPRPVSIPHCTGSSSCRTSTAALSPDSDTGEGGPPPHCTPACNTHTARLWQKI